MGAHSLGRAKTENSGYDGSWTPDRETKFDNEMFEVLHHFPEFFENKVFIQLFIVFCIVLFNVLLYVIFHLCF